VTTNGVVPVAYLGHALDLGDDDHVARLEPVAVVLEHAHHARVLLGDGRDHGRHGRRVRGVKHLERLTKVAEHLSLPLAEVSRGPGQGRPTTTRDHSCSRHRLYMILSDGERPGGGSGPSPAQDHDSAFQGMTSEDLLTDPKTPRISAEIKRMARACVTALTRSCSASGVLLKKTTWNLCRGEATDPPGSARHSKMAQNA
jgi:hypothetical protein